jgi:hypothetical protein
MLAVGQKANGKTQLIQIFMATKKPRTHLPAARVALKGSARPRPATSKLVGELHSREQIWVIMRVRQFLGSPPLPGHDYFMTHRPGQRKVYSKEEFTQTFGASQADLDAVAGFAKDHGMSVVESHAGKRHVIISGTAAQINKAFGITLKKYEAPAPKPPQRAWTKDKAIASPAVPGPIHTYTYRGFDGAVQLPAALDGIVTAVLGLDERLLGHRAGASGNPPGTQYLNGAQIAQRYNFPTTGAAGQTIGIFAPLYADSLSPDPGNPSGGPIGASYLQSDIDEYFTNLQSWNSSTAFNPSITYTPPNIKNVPLTVSGTPYQNNPGSIQQLTANDIYLPSGFTPTATASIVAGNSEELTQDICTAATIAQGATINVYSTTDTESGWYTFVQEAMFQTQDPTANAPSVLSASWELSSDDSASLVYEGTDYGIGDYTASGTLANNLTSVFQQATAAFGITILIPSGDWGADNGFNYYNTAASNNVPDGNPHVLYPSSDPWVTSCGGTMLGATQEWVWSQATSTPATYNYSNPKYDAGGGGVSAQFPMPPWQITAGIPNPNPSNPPGYTGSYTPPIGNRGMPDIAGMVAHGDSRNVTNPANFFLNGNNYSFIGTSCVAPMYAGLVAVLNNLLGFVPKSAGNPQKGQPIGFLNPFLYEFGSSVCNAINQNPPGTNDSLDTPDSPYYTTDNNSGNSIPWNYCTGWGSVDGTKLLNALSQVFDFYFIVDKNTFGRDEVNDNADTSTPAGASTFQNAFWLVLENFTPNNLGQHPTIDFSGSFYSIPASSNFNSIPPASPVVADAKYISYELGVDSAGNPSSPNTPQRIQLAYDVQFTTQGVNASLQSFPAAGADSPNYFLLGAAISIGGNTYNAETEFELTGGADPHFTNVNPGDKNVSYLSQDLQVFSANENSATNPFNALSGAPQFSPSIANSNSTNLSAADVNEAYAYVQKLIAYLNSNYQPGTPSNDPFAALYNAGSLDTFSSVAPLDAAGNWNFSFAIARVRLTDTNTAATAPNVKVFFRLWNTMATDTDFSPYTTFLSSDKNNNAISSPGNTNPPEFPLVGLDDSTFPFFASENNGAGADYGTNGFNNQPLLNTSGKEQWYYFGCFLNVYDLNNVPQGQARAIPKSLNGLLTGTHDCLVAQIAYDGTPLLNTGGVTLTTVTCDKLAQRNINFTPSGNPGGADAHKIPQTFDLRPSQSVAQPGTGNLLDYPDELMIDWGNVPPGSVANIYWPRVNASDVLDLASRLYPTNTLSAADAHTVQCNTVNGITYIPIPPGSGQNFAGLFTVDLPFGTQGVRAGQKFGILVRRVSTRRADSDQKLAAYARANTGEVHSMPNWRYVVGMFQVTIPVKKDELLLRGEENTLAIMKWRLQQTPPSNRWYPVLQRYISYLAGRVDGFGGNANQVPPSNIGFVPIKPGGLKRREMEFTGKVVSISFDRFGDFESFRLLTEDGYEEEFYSRECEIEKLANRAWVERIVISVIVEGAQKHHPVRIIYRRAPHPF